MLMQDGLGRKKGDERKSSGLFLGVLILFTKVSDFLDAPAFRKFVPSSCQEGFCDKEMSGT